MRVYRRHVIVVFFFFNDTATTEIYTLSLHDALPIWRRRDIPVRAPVDRNPHHDQWTGLSEPPRLTLPDWLPSQDRKSTRLNSSHLVISYAVFCLKKKKH